MDLILENSKVDSQTTTYSDVADVAYYGTFKANSAAEIEAAASAHLAHIGAVDSVSKLDAGHNYSAPHAYHLISYKDSGDIHLLVADGSFTVEIGGETVLEV